MNWTELLMKEVEDTYRSAFMLIDLADNSKLGWKPATGSNWMTMGQALHHMTNACGFCMRGFVTGDWGMPEGSGASDDMPTAEKLPTVASGAEARKLLEEDKRLALDMIARAGENMLATTKVAAPWDPREEILGFQLLVCVKHLSQHKGQLFYYLKLQGKPVHTGHLWGMA
jgi:hypothetical protein